MASVPHPRIVRVFSIFMVFACVLVGGRVYANLSLQTSQPVSMIDFHFAPPSIVVPLMTPVTWTNAGTLVHTATSDTALFNTGNVVPGQSNSFTFTTVGTFPYYCVYHGAPGGVGMSGTIIVVPPAIWLPVVGSN